MGWYGPECGRSKEIIRANENSVLCISAIAAQSRVTNDASRQQLKFNAQRNAFWRYPIGALFSLPGPTNSPQGGKKATLQDMNMDLDNVATRGMKPLESGQSGAERRLTPSSYPLDHI